MKTGPIVAMAALSLVWAIACAQQYPVKPVRVVIPWPPGVSNDVVGHRRAEVVGGHETAVRRRQPPRRVRRDRFGVRRQESARWPTIAEAGVPGYEFTAWIGTLAPAATPKPIVDRLNTEINKVLRMPDVAQNLKSQTLEPLIMTPVEFGRRLKSDYDKYERVVKLTGAKVD